MDVLWKGALGGFVTALIVVASKRGNILPGILPLAPIFTIIALLAVGSKGGPAGFRTACLAGVRTIPAYLAFLAGRVDYRVAIAGGLLAWLVAVLAMFLLPKIL
jgi:uncharacterized membrane protein (GlpM family)